MKELLTAAFLYGLGFGATLFVERWSEFVPWGLSLRRAALWPLYLFTGVPRR